MSAKPIREFDGKHLLNYWIPKETSVAFIPDNKLCRLQFDLSLLEISQSAFDQDVLSIFASAEKAYPWLLTTKLVCKPDQLIKRRGKNGLLGINLDWAKAKEWIAKKAGTIIQVGFIN
jgi:ATP citrate (pro-S)-lyase